MTEGIIAALAGDLWIKGVSTAASVLAVAVLVRGWWCVRGTTLVGPWAWLFVATVVLGVVSVASEPARATDASNGAVRLVYGALTVCPGIALLGAKRPQDVAWQFIVLTLWIVLTLPALRTVVLRDASSLQIHWAHSWFLLALLTFTWANSLFTSLGPAVVLMGFGQAILLGPFLPIPLPHVGRLDVHIGVGLFACSVPMAWGLIKLRKPLPRGIERLWRDFRDGFGVAWSVRVADRIDATARASGWGIRADWRRIHGIPSTDNPSEMTPDELRVFHQNLRNLLRRFVSDPWITPRLNEDTHLSP